MDRFEEHQCSALEHEGPSFLAAVLTFDGSRHWVFYTSDGYRCAARIAQILLEC